MDLKESSLHLDLKRWYFKEGDKIEVPIDDYIIDIVRDSLLIEIQTGNFSSIKKKLLDLLDRYNVRIVYPVVREKYLLTFSRDYKFRTRRKSSKKGNFIDIFDELVRIPEVLNRKNFSFDVVFVKIEEIRVKDGKGSRRRKGISIKDRKLTEVEDSILFNNKYHFLSLLPEDLVLPFSNKILAKKMKLSVSKVRKITYTLRKINLIDIIGKRGNELFFNFV